MDRKNILKIIVFGFIVWLIPTIVTYITSFTSGLYLFDVVSALSIAITVIVFAYIYFKDVDSHLVREGLIIGVVWLLISIVLDIVLVLLGITKLTLTQYAVYVAPIYIIIPAVTIGFGMYIQQKNEEISS
jgi:hypothetical protein